MTKYGVLVGRFSPLHLGHEKIIQNMIDDCGIDNCVVLIGSANATLRFRTPFDYKTRNRWIRRIFPDLRLGPIGDFAGDDRQWFLMLDDILQLSFPGVNVQNDITFYGGKEEDVNFYYNCGRQVKIVDRNVLPISATNVRRLLLLGEEIESIVNPKIASEVKEIFNKQVKKLDDLRDNA